MLLAGGGGGNINCRNFWAKSFRKDASKISMFSLKLNFKTEFSLRQTFHGGFCLLCTYSVIKYMYIPISHFMGKIN